MSGARLQPCVSVGCAWGQRPEHACATGFPCSAASRYQRRGLPHVRFDATTGVVEPPNGQVVLRLRIANFRPIT